MNLEFLVRRLFYGDSAISGNYRVEYIDPPNAEATFTVMHSARLLYMGQQPAAFVRDFPWRREKLVAPDTSWHIIPAGAMENPLWETIRSISFYNFNHCFVPARQTGRRRSLVTLSRLPGHRPQYTDGQVQAVISRRQRGNDITEDVQFVVGGVYAVLNNASALRTLPVWGYIQIQHIEEIEHLEQLRDFSLFDEGYASWDAFVAAWRRTRWNGSFRPRKRAWRLHVAPVYTTLPEFEPTCVQLALPWSA